MTRHQHYLDKMTTSENVTIYLSPVSHPHASICSLSFSTRTDDDDDEGAQKKKKNTLRNKHYRYTIQPPQIPVQAEKEIKNLNKKFPETKSISSTPTKLCLFSLFKRKSIFD